MKLIPWRDPSIGPVLIGCLFRLAVIFIVHTKKHGNIEKTWNKFQPLVFQQPEFNGYFGSAKALRKQLIALRLER